MTYSIAGPKLPWERTSFVFPKAGASPVGKRRFPLAMPMGSVRKVVRQLVRSSAGETRSVLLTTIRSALVTWSRKKEPNASGSRKFQERGSIDDGDYGIESDHTRQGFVRQDLDNLRCLCDAARFDQQHIRPDFLGNSPDTLYQAFLLAAADASAGHLDHIRPRLRNGSATRRCPGRRTRSPGPPSYHGSF